MADDEIIITPLRSFYREIASAIRIKYDDEELAMTPSEFPSYIMDIPEQSGAGGQTDPTTIIEGKVRKVVNNTATNVKSYTFAFCDKLTTATFPECLSIGDSVFYSCPRLRGLSLPKVEYIGKYAFQSCNSLSLVYLPECLSIDDYAFAACTKLETISFPKVETVGQNAFNNNTALYSISLPNCKSVSSYAFQYCNGSSFTSIYLPECENIGYYAFRSCSNLIDISLPNVKIIQSNAFASIGKIRKINFPEAIVLGNSVIASDYYYPVFSSGTRISYLSEISLPKAQYINLFGGGITGTDYYNSLITSLSFPECKLLAGIVNFDGLVSLYLPKCITISACTNNDRLSDIDAPNLTTINYGGLSNCWRLSSLSRMPYLTKIDTYGFYGTGLVEVSNSTISYINPSAFGDCRNLKKVSLPNLTYFASFMFRNCMNLEEVYAPKVSYVAGNVFYQCYSLKELSLPKCYSISANAFAYCSNLSKLTFFGKISTFSSAQLSSTPFYKSSYLGYYGSIYVPSVYVSWWKSKVGNVYSDRIVALDSSIDEKYIFQEEFASSNISAIPEYKSQAEYILRNAFYSCSNLAEASLSTCIDIDMSAFDLCSNLLSIDFPNCENIDNYAFRSCSNLTTINLPKVKYLGSYVFWSCSKLTEAILPEVEYIGPGAFYRCMSMVTFSCPNLLSIGGFSLFSERWPAIKTVYIPKLKSIPDDFLEMTGVTSVTATACEYVGGQGFYSCGALREIDLPNCKYLSTNAFEWCWNLSSISLPVCSYVGAGAFNSCALPRIDLPMAEYIGEGAFGSCYGLSYVDAPNCASMGIAVFSGCRNLLSFNIPAFSLLTEIGNRAFYDCNKLSLPSLNLSQLTTIGASAFTYCSLIASSITSLELPNLEFIGSYAFGGSCYSISYISLPKLKTLGGAITNMNPMISVYLPQCQNISYLAFNEFLSAKTIVLPMAKSFTYSVGQNLSNLQSVYLLSTELPSIVSSYASSMPFYSCINLSIYVRQSMVSQYKELFAGSTGISWYSSRFVGITDEQVADIIAEAETW